MLKSQCAPCQQRITHQRQHPVLSARESPRHRRQLRPRAAGAVSELLGAAVVAAGGAGFPPAAAAAAAVHFHPPVLAAVTAAAAVPPAPDDATLVSAAAWFAVAAFSMAALGAMVRAFFQAKTAIDRRVEGSRLKEQEEEARKQKVKDMFDRL